jgi:hypothetical protein
VRNVLADYRRRIGGPNPQRIKKINRKNGSCQVTKREGTVCRKLQVS